MKKKILLCLCMVALLVCIFALSVSADTIKTSSTDEYGELTIFDTPIGRTEIGNTKDDGTIARTVLFDGTSYYTVPTTYLLSKNAYEKDILFQLDFGAINKALSKSFNKKSIIRCELPASIVYIGDGMQNFNGCENMVEVKLNDGLRFAGNSTYKAFTNCKKLKELDMSMVVFEYEKVTYSIFEYCSELEKIILPDAHYIDGKPVNYATDYTFNGCKKLKEIVNYENFFVGSTSINQKMFMDCYLLPEIKIWDGVTSIGSRAFQSCSSITEIIIPDSVTTIGTNETVFASCTSLKKVVLPKKVALGKYCFEKCTGLTDVWMPTEASTFNAQVFGQCGSDLNVTFHFATSTNTITVTDTNFNRDPYLTAIGKEGDARIALNTPLSTKCTVFLGGHNLDEAKSNPCAGICAVCGSASLAENPVHDYAVAIVYANYLANGVKTMTCKNEGCTNKATPVVSSVSPIITEFKGFSVNNDGDAITFGYTFDNTAIAEFEKYNGKIELGFVVAVKALLGDNAPLNADGSVASANVVKAVVTDEEIAYTGADFILRGDWDKMVDLDSDKVAETDVKKVEFYMAGYLMVGGTATYLNVGASGNTADTVTFNNCNVPEIAE